MADYKTMYFKLFNGITNAVTRLQTAQSEAMELYLNQEEPDIVVLDQPDDEGGSTPCNRKMRFLVF